MWTEGANEHPPTPLSAGWVMVKKEYEEMGECYGGSDGNGHGYGYGDCLGWGDTGRDDPGFGDGYGFGCGDGYVDGAANGNGFGLDSDTKEVIRLRSY